MVSVLILAAVVAAILVASRQPRAQRILRWLPVPLWCYLMPMLLRTAGWLPADPSGPRWITDHVLPVALALLLLGVNLPALARVGAGALAAMAAGAGGIVAGGVLAFALLRSQLPAEAWKGIGALSATWTGGSLNMIALRSVLNIPEEIFAPLVVVDALIAYSWMACLISCKNAAPLLNRWLRDPEEPLATAVASAPMPATTVARRDAVAALLLCLAIAVACRMLGRWLPIGWYMASATGWTVLLVSSASLALSCVRRLQRFGAPGAAIGYPCLYLVLAALGAQANLTAFLQTPVWILVGAIIVICHAVALMLAGRAMRLPLGLLATASQANVGGVVSAPLVGAVYGQHLAPVGLLLALAGNALGTYIGMGAAAICRWIAAVH